MSSLNWVFRLFKIAPLHVLVSPWFNLNDSPHSWQITFNWRVKIWRTVTLISFIWLPISNSIDISFLFLSCWIWSDKLLSRTNFRFFKILFSQTWNLRFYRLSILNNQDSMRRWIRRSVLCWRGAITKITHRLHKFKF